MRRPDISRTRPDLVRRRKQARPPKAVQKIFRDVEHLAEVAARTAEQLRDAGLGYLAEPLEDALARLAGKHMPKSKEER